MNLPRCINLVLFLAAVICLAACQSVHGPSAKTVLNSPCVEVVHVRCIEDIPCPQSCFFSSEKPASNPSRRYREELAVRDSISILITDSDPQSPFYRPGDSYQYGPFEVPSTGEIKLPYIGEIRVVGRTLASLSAAVTREVQGVSSSADASVLRTDRLEHQAGVIGEVNRPGNYTFDRSEFDALDLIAAAGGGKEHPDNYIYKLNRGGKSYCYDFCTVSNSPFLIEDGDVISVEKDPGYSYYTMGMFEKPCRLQLRGPNTSVADAIVESGGMREGKADPKGIFIFRDAAYCGEWCTQGKSCLPGTKFTAYVLDLSRADFPLLIQKFRLTERDVVYASEAPISHVNYTARELAPIIGMTAAGVALAR